MKIKFEMKYSMSDEVNGKHYVEIPMNVWKAFNQKGRIKSNCFLNGMMYQTSLIPKGEGKYVFQLTKKMIKETSLTEGQIVAIEMTKSEPMKMNKSEEVVKKNISFRKQPTSRSCGQACVAMLLDKSVEEIFELFGKKPLGIGKIVDILNSFGIKNAQKNTRISKKNPIPSPISLLTLKQNGHYHFVVYANGKIYDPARGILNDIPTGMEISLYLEITYR